MKSLSEMHSSHEVVKEASLLTQEHYVALQRGHEAMLQLLENHDEKQSVLGQEVLRKIASHLPHGDSSRPDGSSKSVHGSVQCTSPTSDKIFRVMRQHGSVGKLEVFYGSAAFFRAIRMCPPEGFGMRCDYSPPAWFMNMILSISFTLCLFPRLSVPFTLDYVCEVAWESDIFTFAMTGDMDGLTALLRSGKARATDRDSRGITALHVCNAAL